jgi:hypothetical protein
VVARSRRSAYSSLWLACSGQLFVSDAGRCRVYAVHPRTCKIARELSACISLCVLRPSNCNVLQLPTRRLLEAACMATKTAGRRTRKSERCRVRFPPAMLLQRQLNVPHTMCVAGLSVDAFGCVFIADTTNNVIKRWTCPGEFSLIPLLSLSLCAVLTALCCVCFLLGLLLCRAHGAAHASRPV